MNSKTTIWKTLFSFTASLCLLFLTASCSTVAPISTDDWWDHFEPGHSKEEILTHFDLHRGKWWNYYARGCWLEEGGFWDDAISDFKRAIKVRLYDQRAARSYGMHFWDYFARRELGVCYYNTGNYEEAVKELEESLKTVDSSKAKFYLNKARFAVLSQKDIDKNGPVIELTAFKDGDFVNSSNINLAGKIKDDFYSNAIWINNRRLFIELASNELSFDERLRLVPGENMVSIKASDLVGNQTTKTLKLTLDMRPPVILLDETPIRKSTDQKTLTLQGAIIDDFGIEHFWINDNEIKIEKGKEVAFNEQIDISSTNKITLKAIDIAGNKVYGEHSLDVKSAMLHLRPQGLFGVEPQINPLRQAQCKPFHAIFKTVSDKKYPRLASLDNTLVATSVLQASNQSSERQDEPSASVSVTTSSSESDDTIPPKIITDLKPATVYDKYYVISGEASDNTGISRLLINNEEIKSNSARHVFFNHILTLEEGENPVTITAEDISGNKTIGPPTVIKKETFEFLETDSRYTVALLPLKQTGPSGAVSDAIYPLLMQGFEEEPKRFNFVERDKAKLLEILNEQKISNSELASPDTIVKIGKIKAAEGMLFGTMVEDDKGINISLNMVDTETTKVLVATDVYGEDKSMDNLRWLMKGLAQKIKQRFPMLQGSVVYVSKKGIFVDFGSDLGATVGMKFLLFREVNLGEMRINEPLDVVAQVVQVEKQSCMAKIIAGAETIEQKDLVITK